MVKVENPFYPICLAKKEHKGMQGNEYFTEMEDIKCRGEWLKAKNLAINDNK
jgi:hypothetical protein